MCHEEIHRRSRVDLADRRPVAHPDRKRSPRVAVEPRIRKQRVLTTLRPKRAFLRSAQYELHSHAAGLHSRGGCPPAARTIPPMNRFVAGTVPNTLPTNERKTAQSEATQTKRRCPGMIRFKGVEGRRKMRSNDHETRFCGSVGGGGLRRRIYSRLCPRRLWAWRRVCEPRRLRAQSYHSPGITSAADARLPKPDS